MGEELLGKRVIAENAFETPDGEGRVIAYYKYPSVTIERDDGTRFHCRACICGVVEEDMGLPAVCKRLIDYLDTFGGTFYPSEINADIDAIRAALAREEAESPKKGP